eukprot:143353-Ditylum_brightwellii.AAC.1
MMVLPFLLGFTPRLWQTAIDVMLEKDPGSPKISCLHMIVIVKGDMNAIMKVIWNRQLVPTAKKTHLISLVQFGNCKGCTALDALLLKVVTRDCFCLFCLNRAILNNNAMACYDKMIPEVSPASITCTNLETRRTEKDRGKLPPHQIGCFKLPQCSVHYIVWCCASAWLACAKDMLKTALLNPLWMIRIVHILINRIKKM